MVLTHQSGVRIPEFPKDFRGNITNVAETNKLRWLEENGHWLEHVDQKTLLILANVKPVLKNRRFKGMKVWQLSYKWHNLKMPRTMSQSKE